MIGSSTPLIAAGAQAPTQSRSISASQRHLRQQLRPVVRDPRDPGRHVGGQPREVVLGCGQIHQTPMHPNPDTNAETESALQVITEPRHLPRDLHPGLHRAARIVFTRNRMTNTASNPSPLVEPICPSYPFTMRSTCSRYRPTTKRYVSGSTCMDSAVESTRSAKNMVFGKRRRISPTSPGCANRSSASAGLSVTTTSCHPALHGVLDR